MYDMLHTHTHVMTLQGPYMPTSCSRYVTKWGERQKFFFSKTVRLFLLVEKTLFLWYILFYSNGLSFAVPTLAQIV